jgi:hypothetical protein
MPDDLPSLTNLPVAVHVVFAVIGIDAVDVANMVSMMNWVDGTQSRDRV